MLYRGYLMRTISIGLPDLLLEEVDELITKNKKFRSRSEVLRFAIEQLLSEELAYYKSHLDSED